MIKIVTMTRLGLVMTLVGVISGQDDYVSECPTDNGFFADALQCDKYYECKDGEVSLSNINYY